MPSEFRRKVNDSWGGWVLKSRGVSISLSYSGKGLTEPYEIDLLECGSSAQVLDWIAQIAAKPWATNGVLAGLVRAIDDVLLLQENYCSWGKDQRPSKVAIKALVAEAVRRYPDRVG